MKRQEDTVGAVPVVGVAGVLFSNVSGVSRFSRIPRNASVAVVGLLDADRLWFKSRLGLEVPQLDRDIAFCAHAVMCPGEVLVVEDLTQDNRFKDNPLVTNAPYLPFYAGAPLVDPNGLALGTLAVVDTKPRELWEKHSDLLKDLSVLAMTALENQRRALMLTRLALTDHLTGLGNRAQFDRELGSEMARAKRTGEPFSVLYMDLDGFKAINDHTSGPRLDMLPDRRKCVAHESLRDSVEPTYLGVNVRVH